MRTIINTSLLLLCLGLSLSSKAQSDLTPEQYAKAKGIPFLTASNGRYQEIFDNPKLKRMGTVMFNTETNKVEYFIVEGDTAFEAAYSRSRDNSRFLSIDPLFAKYPSITPYAFVNNNPIIAVDPDGRDIIFVNQQVGDKESPQITKQNFESIINTLYSTEKGKEIIEYYLENPNENLYIAVGEIKNASDGPGSLGRTYTYSEEKNGIKTQIPFTKAIIDSEPNLSEFKDAGVDETKKSALILIDQNLYTEKNMDFYEQKDGGGSKGGAKVLAHEIAAHAKNAPEQYSGEGHTKWGQTAYEGKFKTGEGDAKKLNTQVNKLRSDDAKSDLKLSGTGTTNVYKVTKKQ